MKTKLLKMFTAFAAVVLLAGVSVRASEMDGRIESSAKNSYVFKTYLKDDSITTKSKDGVVTLKGTVKEESHKSLAQDTVENLPGVKKVENELVFKGESPAKNSDGWIALKVPAPGRRLRGNDRQGNAHLLVHDDPPGHARNKPEGLDPKSDDAQKQPGDPVTE